MRVKSSFFIFLIAFGWTAALPFLARGADALHYGIHLNIIDLKAGKIDGFTDVHFRVGSAPILTLELLDLTVEKITLHGHNIKYERSGYYLHVHLPPELKDTATVRVFYGGKPAAPSWFGGFYMNDKYAYNLGVLFDGTPHNFGKVWYPCIDNFTDKALYDFYIRTAPEKTAVCAGKLVSQTSLADHTVLHHWKLSHPISTYLASVAVSEYVPVKDVYHGLRGAIPIEIYVPPGQVEATRGSFRHLKFALQTFEKLFGPYEWERVGYAAVPMQGGAMEHATNIAYPVHLIDGTTAQDRLWSHELSHSWFGNLVTCASAGDMWLNEGFARYSEALFIEALEGKKAFKDYMRGVHKRALSRAHVSDKGYLALVNVPEDHTYGSTVYDKGGTVAHTLRGYLGDTLFFGALRAYFQRYKFQNIDTQGFCMFLSEYTRQDLQPFFAQWVYTPGYAYFYVDSMATKPEGKEYRTALRLCRRLKQKPPVTFNQPVEALFISGERHVQARRTLIFSADSAAAWVTLPFEPVDVILDPEEKMCAAAVKQTQTVRGSGKYDFPGAPFSLQVNQTSDSALVNLATVYLPPVYSAARQTNLTPPSIYWALAGDMPLDWGAQGVFSLNPDDYFDADVLKRLADEDVPAQLGLFYRYTSSDNWALIAPIGELQQYTPTVVRSPFVRKGEYALFYFK